MNNNSKRIRTWSEEQAIDFGTGLYSALLRRPLNPDENPGLIDGMQYEMTRVDAFINITGSDECIYKFDIIQAYLVIRQALPSDREVDDWFNNYRDHDFDKRWLASAILYTDECNKRYGI